MKGKEKLKRMLSGLIGLTVVVNSLLIMPLSTFAASSDEQTFVFDGYDNIEIIETGWCGENVQWTLYSNGVLELNGTGATYDYDLSKSDNQEQFPEWYDQYAYDVKKIEIHEGVNRIGDYIFAGSYPQLETVNLPDSIREIGYYSFMLGAKHEGITTTINKFPANLEIIEDGAFFGITFTDKIIFPDELREIGSLAVNSDSRTYVFSKKVETISELAFGIELNEEYFDLYPDSWEAISDMLERIVKRDDSILDMCQADKSVIVYGYRNTISEIYASENGFTFIALDEQETTEPMSDPTEATTESITESTPATTEETSITTSATQNSSDTTSTTTGTTANSTTASTTTAVLSEGSSPKTGESGIAALMLTGVTALVGGLVLKKKK